MSDDAAEPNGWSVLRRQLAVCAAFALLLVVIVASLYFQDRRREWTLRTEQSQHRLDVAFDLISREVDRVRADALYLADQNLVRQFAAGNRNILSELTTEFASFLRHKGTYDQLRLLDLSGHESIRLNYAESQPSPVDETQLQDKSDRYYFRESRSLVAGDVFVSEFDLNLEHGRVEKPLKPVIRFVTPVVADSGDTKAFVVLNYLGARLLSELDEPSMPGFTMLLRGDGNYLRSPDPNDSWGWLLGKNRSFVAQFPVEWARMDELHDCQLTANGAFAVRRLRLGKRKLAKDSDGPPRTVRDSIIIVSYVARDRVFSASNDLLKQLLLLAGCVFIPVTTIARYWARESLNRQQQSRRLRSLSSRLLRIQEDERRAISREIHDELGQQVTAINLDLKLAERHIESHQAKPHLQRAIHENEGLLQSLHAFATRVRPAVLDDLGLQDAVESHLAEFQQRSGIEVDLDLHIDSASLTNEIADNVYRLLQESLNNVLKHAEASKVWCSLLADQSEVNITIRDDGCGYAMNENHGQRLGLVGMRERVDLLSGELRIESDTDQGTCIKIRLPVPNDTKSAEDGA